MKLSDLRPSKRFILAFLLLSFLCLAVLQPILPTLRIRVTASPDPTVAVDPATCSANPYQYATVNVTITDVTNLFSWGFRLGWPGGLLQASTENITEGPFLKQGGTTAFTKKAFTTYIDVACTFLGANPGVSGSGTLATVTLKALKTGNATLDLYSTKLLDPTITEIAHSAQDGYFYTTWPVAKFTYTPHPSNYPGHPIVDETITFNATGSYDPDDPYDSTPGGIVSYKWDFNDGNITTTTNPIITHEYGEHGDYRVTLNVTDDDGELYSVDHPVIGTTISVQLHDIAVINVTVTPAEVSIGGTFSVNVTVLNQGSATETLNVTVYANMQPVATHLFEYDTIGPPPHYIPQHHTSLKAGENGTATVTWDTTGVPVGTYEISVKAFLVSLIEGKWQSAPDLEKEEDMFDNGMFYGNVNTTAVVRHDLAITQLRVSPTSLKIDEWASIKVTVKNEGTVAEQFNTTITVEYGSEQSTLPTKWQNQTILAGTTVALNYNWLKGDDTTPEGQYNITANVVLINATTLDFLQPYNETVPDDDPTENSRSVLETLRMYPVANFTYSPAEPVIDSVITFDASVSYAPGASPGTIVGWSWDFGDGANDTGQIVTHAYTDPKAYAVKLTVTDDESLNNTHKEDVTVQKLNSTITLFASTLTVPISLNTTFSGSITPVRTNTTVTINYTRGEETAWTILANSSTDEDGQYSYVWAPTEVGSYKLKAFWQGDELTNEAESSVLNATVIIQDLAIVDVVLSKIELTTGESMSINVTASNKGTATESFNVTVYYNNTLLETKTVNNLAPGADESLSFNWDTQGIGEGVYTVKAVAEPLPGETYDADNSRTYGIIIQAQPPLNIFLYTTIGMAIVIAIMAVYLVRTIKFKPK